MRSHSILLLALLATGLTAQGPPTFEVASVRVNKSGTAQTSIGMLPNGVNFVNLPLRAVIQFAYGINQPSKLTGFPDWANTERFDINARAAGPVTVEQRRLMLQALLADRFKLVTKWEKREVSVLALMPARNDGRLGMNLVESKGCITPGSAAAKDAATASAQATICGPKAAGPGRLVLTGVPMQQFTALLGTLLGRTVIDKTGLAGRYDIDLTFTPEQSALAAADAAADPNGPTLYTAVREQLGLKLDSQRDQENVLVIDHVERQPSEN
jgi:uncharacterized protein (TIGR03435 family)